MSRTHVLAIVLSLFAIRCGGCDGAQATDAQADAGLGALTPEQAAKVLARVGDVTITVGDFVAVLEHMDQFDRLRYQSPDRRKELLNEMIEVELLAQEATAKGYDKDPAAQQELRAVLRNALLEDAKKQVPQANDIPENEVRAYYDAHKADYKDPERRRISLIVLKDAATANAVLAQALKATATGWGDLVRTRSIDAQARANVPLDLAGDFGMVSPPGDSRGDNPRIPDEVRKAAFDVGKVGDLLDHVVSAEGKFYVVKLTQKSDAHERTFAEAERSIRVKLVDDKIRAKENDMLTSLRAQFPVKIDDTALANVHVPAADAGK